jgi:hypothetical protein
MGVEALGEEKGVVAEGVEGVDYEGDVDVVRSARDWGGGFCMLRRLVGGLLRRLLMPNGRGLVVSATTPC